MDRNAVIASVLIAIIMMVWLVWLQPTPPPASPPSPADTLAATTPTAPEPPSDAISDIPSPPQDSLLAPARTGTARQIVVDHPLYRATFSTKGATLVSFVLKAYPRYDRLSPVEMVDTTKGGALSLAFTTPNNHLVDTRTLFFASAFSGDTLRVGNEPTTLTFETRLGSGAIRQMYTFTPETYELGLQVEQSNAASFATNEGYELAWNGAIPNTEANRDDEVRHSGAYARSGGVVEKVEVQNESFGEKSPNGTVDWIAVKNKYFTAVVIPSSPTRGAALLGEKLGEAETPSLHANFSASLLMPPATGTAETFRLYVGPMEFYRLDAYDLDLYDMVDYGWDFFEAVTRPFARFMFIPVFNILDDYIPSFGVIIIIFAFLIKLLTLPMTNSSMRSMARMKVIQPQMQAIQEKYANDPQKQQEAMMKLYREAKVNPLGGCLPMLLQYPILIALWQFLPQAIELRQQGFLWAADLSAPDPILHLPFTIPLYGNFVAGFTLLMGLAMIIQMRVQMQSQPSNPQTAVFTYVFPVMLFVIFNKLASGLNLYYLVFNLISVLHQQWYNRKAVPVAPVAVSSNGKDLKTPAPAPKPARPKKTKS